MRHDLENTALEKRKQDKCHQSFRQILNLLDLTDTSLDGLCEKCSELPDTKRMITRALDQILAPKVNGTDDTVVNRPKYLAILYEHPELPVLTGDIYRSTPMGFTVLASEIQVDRGTFNAHDITKEDVFTINAIDDPLFLPDFQENFHPLLRKTIGEPLKNCVGYHVHGDNLGIILGFNYTDDVGRFEGEVIKTLAITMGALATLARQITEIKSGFVYLIESLGRASEVNDEDTGNHVLRVNTYAKHLARAMGESETFCNEIGLVAQMHDVGKIHTPSSILRKPGHLTLSEREEMEKHTFQGEIILGNASRLAMARNIAGGHHENYDGSGYPRGLKGNEIPLEAQIVKIVDVYDALRTKRPYKPALGHEETIQEIYTPGDRIHPRHFNPKILNLFKQEANAFAEIYKNLQ